MLSAAATGRRAGETGGEGALEFPGPQWDSRERGERKTFKMVAQGCMRVGCYVEKNVHVGDRRLDVGVRGSARLQLCGDVDTGGGPEGVPRESDELYTQS